MIREGSIDDAAGAAALATLVFPEFVRTEESTAHAMRVAPPDAHAGWWCATDGGEVLGWASATIVVETTEPGVAWLSVLVHPDARGRGIGGELLGLAEAHVVAHGARKLLGMSRDDGRTVSFARRRGYERTATDDVLAADPRTVAPPDPPPGVELRPLAAFADDPRPVFEVDAESVLDEPGDVQLDAIPYGLWLDEWWRNPALDREVSTVALVDGRPASVTFVMTDRASGRGTNNGTGTLRAFRGRGLATMAKRASLVRAARLGITAVYTGNEVGNAAMQAVNRKLGYRPSSTLARWAKAVDATGAPSA